MTRWMPAALLMLALVGCDRTESKLWKDKYLKEIDYHYQTQQIKNAEIAVRDKEIENLKAFMAVLSDRITGLEKEREQTAARPRGPIAAVAATITAVAGEIQLIVLDAGKDQGILEGDEFRVLRDSRPIGKARVDRVDRKWSAAKMIERTDEPRVGDRVERLQPEKPK